MIVRKVVLYHGHVQGVGFRYTTQVVAESYAVAGHVRNLPTGAVELIAEGEEAEVRGFLGAVAHRMAAYIHGQTIRDEVPQGLKAFGIR